MFNLEFDLLARNILDKCSDFASCPIQVLYRKIVNRQSMNDTNNQEDGSSRVNYLEDLLYQATIGLARIFSKQGAVYAKLDSHNMALVSSRANKPIFT